MMLSTWVCRDGALSWAASSGVLVLVSSGFTYWWHVIFVKTLASTSGRVFGPDGLAAPALSCQGDKHSTNKRAVSG